MSFKYLDPTGVGYFWYKVKSLVSTKYTKPDAGIPKSDLESSVQTTLTNADTVVTNFSNKIDKVNGATAGNIAILNATGSITDGNTSIQNVELNVDTNGHTYVDLGLPSGTLWATCNVGATNPEDYGDYYAWGETQTKQEYSWNTYQHGSSNSNITKYNVTDGKTELEPDDDVCHIVMGGDWRMPTEVQCRELIANTTYTWTTTNGVTGILLTSTVNNNTLFIPASGYINNTSITDLTIQSCIWSSNLYIHETYGIMGVSELSYRETGSLIVINNDRYKGYPCRGIINKSGIQFKQGKTIMPVKTTASAVEFPDGETALSKVSDLEENKVDKVSGKSLSTNDYTTEDKTKLSNIASEAQVNVLETVKVNDNPLTITNKSVNIDLSNYAQKDGSYSGMTVGAAEDLVSAESVASEFTSRITGGSTAVGKGGTAIVDRIKGRTLVWNQQVLPLYNITFGTGLIISIGPDGKISLSGSLSVSGGRTSYVSSDTYKIHIITGHKYICICSAPSGVTPYVTKPSDTSTTLAILPNGIGQATSTFDGRLGFHFSAGDYTGVSFYVSIIDLTLMFGAGNEPATPEEFKALYPGPYYAYNPGELINNGKQTEYDLVWNQMIENPNFANNTLTNWNTGSGPTFAFDNRVLTVTGVNGSLYLEQGRSITAGHKYYVSLKAGFYNTTLQSTLYNMFLFNGNNGVKVVFQAPVTNSMNKYSIIVEADTGYYQVGFSSYPIPPGATLKIDCDYGVNVIDLTLMFGAGYEPATPEEFEAMFPADYYPYDAGTEQHFSFPQFKTKIETVGFNLLNPDTVINNLAINITDGTASTTQVTAATGYIPVFPGVDYFFNIAFTIGSSAYGIAFYDAGKNFISGQASPSGSSITRTAPANARFMRATIRLASVSAACINISDTSRNGTYEPYWRSELELGLGDIKVKSHNLWDEEWEAGGINTTTGENAGGSYFRTPGYITVLPSTRYYNYSNTNDTLYLFYYDSNKGFISYINQGNGSFTTPSNAAFLRFCDISRSSYTNEVCLNTYDPAYNGRYEPYGDGGVISLTGGLKSAGTAYDEISGGRFVKRLESVDMGTLTWTNYETESTRTTASLAGCTPVGRTVYPNIVSPKYTIVPYSSRSDSDKNITLHHTNQQVWIADSSLASMTGTQIATLFSGVYLYYQLAQPIEYELAEAIPTAMRNDPYGTERRLPEDTAAIATAPFRADITYSTNIKEAVQSMHQNFINVNSMQDFLAELGTLMGGTWTMRPADGKFDFTFTPNPSNE